MRSPEPVADWLCAELGRSAVAWWRRGLIVGLGMSAGAVQPAGRDCSPGFVVLWPAVLGNC